MNEGATRVTTAAVSTCSRNTRRVRSGDGQRPRGRNAQAVHGLAAQEFADAGAQHGAPVAHARVGREPGALELPFLVPGRGLHPAQQDRPPVAQLPGPHAELVAAVDAGQTAALPGNTALPDSACNASDESSQAGSSPRFCASARLRADPVHVGQRRRAAAACRTPGRATQTCDVQRRAATASGAGESMTGCMGRLSAQGHDAVGKREIGLRAQGACGNGQGGTLRSRPRQRCAANAVPLNNARRLFPCWA